MTIFAILCYLNNKFRSFIFVCNELLMLRNEAMSWQIIYQYYKISALYPLLRQKYLLFSISLLTFCVAYYSISIQQFFSVYFLSFSDSKKAKQPCQKRAIVKRSKEVVPIIIWIALMSQPSNLEILGFTKKERK